MRREANEQTLSLSDYKAFAEAMCLNHQVALVSLQGYEPLLPESWSFSEAVLATASRLQTDTALITNGTHLEGRVDDLIRLGLASVTVSVDAAEPALHDLSRRTPGAFAATLRGLKAACDSPLRGRIMVASVLQRNKASYIWGMPALLASLGIRQWVVTPVYKVGRRQTGGPSEDIETIVFQLRRLNNVARELDIELFVDDEFGDLESALDRVPSAEEMRVRRLKKLSQIVRLSPNGACSVGEDILRRADVGVVRWEPQTESADAFIHSQVTPRIIPHSTGSRASQARSSAK
jgi:hypothetical protein